MLSITHLAGVRRIFFYFAFPAVSKSSILLALDQLISATQAKRKQKIPSIRSRKPRKLDKTTETMLNEFNIISIEETTWMYGILEFGVPVTLVQVLATLTGQQSFLLLPKLEPRKGSQQTVFTVFKPILVDTSLCKKIFPSLNLKLYQHVQQQEDHADNNLPEVEISSKTFENIIDSFEPIFQKYFKANNALVPTSLPVSDCRPLNSPSNAAIKTNEVMEVQDQITDNRPLIARKIGLYKPSDVDDDLVSDLYFKLQTGLTAEKRF